MSILAELPPLKWEPHKSWAGWEQATVDFGPVDALGRDIQVGDTLVYATTHYGHSPTLRYGVVHGIVQSGHRSVLKRDRHKQKVVYQEEYKLTVEAGLSKKTTWTDSSRMLLVELLPEELDRLWQR